MENKVTQAIKALNDGEIVSFPTETVYALAANAYNNQAVDGVFRLKKRSYNMPLAVMVKNIEEAKKLVHFNEAALKLAEKLSLIHI